MTEVEFVREVAAMPIEKDDIVLLKHDGHLTEEQKTLLITAVKSELPDNRCFVLEGGIDMCLLRPCACEAINRGDDATD